MLKLKVPIYFHSSVNVFNTRALIEDTIFTSVLGEWTTISMSRDHDNVSVLAALCKDQWAPSNSIGCFVETNGFLLVQAHANQSKKPCLSELRDKTKTPLPEVDFRNHSNLAVFPDINKPNIFLPVACSIFLHEVCDSFLANQFRISRWSALYTSYRN